MEQGKIILEAERLMLTELTEQSRGDAIRLYYQVNSLGSGFTDLSDSFKAAIPFISRRCIAAYHEAFPLRRIPLAWRR